MKKIINDSRIQTLIAVLIMFASYLVSTLQGLYGVVFPFILLAFFILVIVFVYYIIVIPMLDMLKPKEYTSDRLYDMNRIKEYELTTDFKEIWILTSNLKLASDHQQFGSVIASNIARGIKYKFFIYNDNVAKYRAKEMMDFYSKNKGLFEVYLMPHDAPFIDQNTDYDLFFTSDTSNNKGLIGITIGNIREYVEMSPELFIKLQMFILEQNLESLK